MTSKKENNIQEHLEREVKKQLEIIKRGVLEIINEKELEDKIRRSLEQGRPLRIKLGIDPTAPDIHLGFAVVLRKLKDFQGLGHQIVLIIGDFTAKIGDPSGRKKTRPQLTNEEIARNMKTYLEQISKILDVSKLEIRYNSEWLNSLTLADIISLASQFTLQQILAREDFKNRIKAESPLHIHEILYPLCQAYDSLKVKADIEIGGMDQKFNCLLGRDLQKDVGEEPQTIILMPILTGPDRRKMSKSYGNYIGIAEPPQEMFNKIMSIPDDLMKEWFILCTDLSAEEIDRILKEEHPMEAKKILAYEITKLYHGQETAEKAKEEFERVFQQRETPSEAILLEVTQEKLNLSLLDLLHDLGVVKSKSEGRRLLNAGAIEINNQIVSFEKQNKVSLKDGDIIRVGKKRFYRLKISQRTI